MCLSTSIYIIWRSLAHPQPPLLPSSYRGTLSPDCSLVSWSTSRPSTPAGNPAADPSSSRSLCLDLPSTDGTTSPMDRDIYASICRHVNLKLPKCRYADNYIYVVPALVSHLSAALPSAELPSWLEPAIRIAADNAVVTDSA